jgi:hypothetical protein
MAPAMHAFDGGLGGQHVHSARTRIAFFILSAERRGGRSNGVEKKKQTRQSTRTNYPAVSLSLTPLLPASLARARMNWLRNAMWQWVPLLA